jgi:signal transduction histidine kinase/FixJ family two-component response regulator
MPETVAAANEYSPRILVIDDEKRIRDGCQTILTASGYGVTCAENGKQGLDIINREHYDIILLDLMMPELSGLDVLPMVKENHPDTVVIVITGYATVEYSIEAMKAGAFDFLAKPFSPNKLKVVVSKAIEHTRALKDIATEKSRMKDLINRLSAGVMATDSRKHVVLANPSFQDMIDYHGKTIIGRPVDTFIEHTGLLNMINQAVSTGPNEKIEFTDELEWGEDDNENKRVLSVCCAPFKDRVGMNLGTITVLHDITVLKKVARMKSDFVSLVAHEIRSPMNSVLMQLKVIMDGLAGEVTEKQKDLLSKASRKIYSLVDMTTELLDLSKIESGLITLEKETIQFDGLIQDQINFHRESAETKNIAIHFKRSADLPPVSANRRNMEEVIANLVTNAIKYSPEGGTITLSAAIENDYLCITVTDTGWGIPPEDLKHVFNRFYRVKNDKTRHITGTGLGLSIVKRIVEAHHGTVDVQSTLNQGSTFRVYIPHIAT